MRLSEVDALFAERSAAASRARADIVAFKARYRHEVGLLHEELDRLELALAEAELGELLKRPEAAAPPGAAPAARDQNHSRDSRPTRSASCFAMSPR